MCGIVGYVGRKRAAPLLVAGLKQLEYRGYDSAGIALLWEGEISIIKRKGRVSELDHVVSLEGNIGIGHTRWATHGMPSAQNAHPHIYRKFAIVHNGIIENFSALKEECLSRGEIFNSETDSEVIAHLLDRYYEDDLLAAVRRTAQRLVGSYAVAVLCSDFPDMIAVCREKSPLVIGIGENGVSLASDIPAIASESEKIYALADGEFALVKEKELNFYDDKGVIQKKEIVFDPLADFSDLHGYKHFMRKEMGEIPTAIANSLVNFEGHSRYSEFCKVLCQTEYLQIIACGTAYHSGIAAKYAIEKLARVPVEVIVASEYRYNEPIIRENTLVIAVSQSGETADTLAAAELARRNGAKVVAVTNAPYSSLTTIVDFVFETKAGREIAVAATKSFNAQLALLYSIAVALGSMKGKETDFSKLRLLPMLSEQVLSSVEKLKEISPEFAKAKSVYFIGRGADYCSALEGSLKLKEISYLPSEGYPAGELKHGTLALIDEGTFVVAILTQETLAEKTMNAVSEVYARGGRVLLITTLAEYTDRKEIAYFHLLPQCPEIFSPILSVIPLQALAYYTALERGNDPDKPRNLAKSVTVE